MEDWISGQFRQETVSDDMHSVAYRNFTSIIFHSISELPDVLYNSKQSTHLIYIYAQTQRKWTGKPKYSRKNINDSHRFIDDFYILYGSLTSLPTIHC
jgi:hypothetical protein